MNIRITVNDQYVNTVKVKTEKKDTAFAYIHKLEAMQATDDILGVGKVGRTDIGIMSLTSRNGVTTNAGEAASDNVQNANGSYIVGNNVSHNMEKTKNLVIDGVDMGVKVRVDIYEPGWVLSTGKTCTSLFGMPFMAYLRSIGSRKISSNGKDAARVVASPTAVLEYIQKHMDTFVFCVKEYGYQWSMEYANELFQNEHTAELAKATAKKREKIEETMSSIEELLNKINNAEPEEDTDDIPEEISEEALKSEALRRMQRLNIWDDVIKAYTKTGEIYQSEDAGIIYKLDEAGQKAVDQVRNDGNVPYHVIVTRSTIGTLYSVLYVSPNTTDWTFERSDRSGIIMNYTYNAEYSDCSEYGDSRFVSCNGGLKRVA